MTYIFDFFNGEVGIRRHAHFLRLHIYNNEEWIRCVAFKQLIDLQIRRAQLGPRMVPSYQLLAGVDFLEHVVHALDVVVVQEPYRWVFFIFFEGHCNSAPVSASALEGMERESGEFVYQQSYLTLSRSCHRSALVRRLRLAFVGLCLIGRSDLLLRGGRAGRRIRYAIPVIGFQLW